MENADRHSFPLLVFLSAYRSESFSLIRVYEITILHWDPQIRDEYFRFVFKINLWVEAIVIAV